MVSGLRRVVTITCTVFALCFASLAQLPTGTPLFNSFDSDGVNTINLATLNIHTQIPIFSKPGKGIPFSAVLNHDNVFWYPSNGRWAYTTNGTSTGLAWVGLAPAATGVPAGYSITPAICPSPSKQGTLVYSNWNYLDIFNTTHNSNTPFQLDSSGCIYGTSGNGTSADGYALAASVTQGSSTGVGPNVPNTTSGTGWAGLQNLKADDAAYASVSLLLNPGGAFSSELKATNFGFNIPPAAAILGIKVEIDRHDVSSAGDLLYDNDVTLLRAGIAVGTNHWSATAWPFTDTIQAYGGSTDTWGVPLTPADVSASNFGVQLSVRTGLNCGSNCDTSATADVDQIRITVYYATPTVSATVTSPSGISMSSGSYADSHSPANTITVTGTSTLSYYDTLSKTAPVLTKTGSPSSLTETYTYCGGNSGGTACAGGGNGSQVSFTVHYTNYTLQTAFGCSGISEYSQTNFPLATSVTLPDGISTYNMVYETTPGNPGATTGRLAYIQLSTSGIISYAYTGANHGINCADGSTMGFAKQTPDTVGTQWTYSRTITSYGSQLTVTSPTPDSNVTVINFDTAGHELQRQINQGSSTLLKTIVTCYNSTLIANCPTQGPGTSAINSMRTYTQIPDGTGIQSEVNTTYNTIALPTEVDTYDWGASTPTTSVAMTYCTGLAANIQDRLCTRTTYAGTTSGTKVADQSFSYFSAGDLKSASDWVSGTGTGAVWLTKNYTYDSYGVLQTAQDVNNTTTTYGSFYCNNAFPGTITSLTVTWTTQVWDCNGGVKTSVTDANNETTTYGHADPFWRVTSVGDALSTTSTTYTSATQTESVLNIGTSSTQDTLTTLDVLGRVNWVQKKQSPTAANWDSVEYLYDSNGRQNKVTVPSSCPSGGCTTLPTTTTTTYDALGRMLTITDPSTAQTNYTYTKNDVLITSPTPNINKQLEYNAVGQLKSVCEITATGQNAGPCGQANPQNGYLTAYIYSPLYLQTVTQNAQGTTQQTRSFGPYDGLGRMGSETNPETGTVNYFYDSLSSDSACGSPSFAGDLVKRVDNANNATCYAYDGLHRMTSEGNTTVSGNTERYFVYDTAVVNGITMSNTVGRMAQAYTAVAPNLSTKVTDEGFSYDIRGEQTGLYQSTPHSGGYYHTTASYFVNGVLASIQGPSPMPLMTYGLEGEGRIAAISAASGQNPLTATTYDSAGHVTAITFGSGDGQSFTFDPNTGRMSEYRSAVGSTPKYVYGDLTWNPNGTLQQLAITDQTHAANSQTCTYSYDDLARASSVSCGTLWSQTFTYDVGLGTAAFGNLSKTGTPPGISFQPIYNNKNQYQNISGFPPTYDANGNLLTDSFHTYTWDPNWNVPTNVDTTALTYDALGRMVEVGGTKQIVYTPLGTKIAFMNGTTYSDGFLDLVGGAQALFGSSAIVSTYHHADWLGSKRLATGTTRNVTLNVAYAPYAETYANSVGTDFNFTGIDNDSFTDLYDFPAREYHPTQGRWISPDPAGLGAVDMTNPQSWNRYAYVMNRPLNLIDPFGLDPCDGILNCVSVTATAPGPGTDQSDPGGDFNDSDATSFVSTGSSGCSINFGGLFSYSTLTPCLSGGGRQWDRGFRHFRLRRRSPAANNGRMPNTITCSTVLPNGRTVGSYVQAVSNQINGPISTTSSPYGPVAQYSGGPSPLSVTSFVYSSINFKIMFQGQGNAAFLGDAGNCAYGAISANIGVPLWAAEAVAGGYALWAGHQDANGPFWMDQSASQQVQPGYSAQCK